MMKNFSVYRHEISMTMKYKILYGVLLAAFAFGGCAKVTLDHQPEQNLPDQEVPEMEYTDEEEPEQDLLQQMPICFSLSVGTTDNQSRTKAIIGESGEHEDHHNVIPLTEACSTGTGKYIRMYTEKKDSDGTSGYDFFDNGNAVDMVFDGGVWKLASIPAIVGNTGDFLTGEHYWDTEKKSKYEFLAFYPSILEKDVIYGGREEDTETHVMNYNSQSTQEDLLIAYNEVYISDPVTLNPSIYSTVEMQNGKPDFKVSYLTKDATTTNRGFSEKFDLSTPVPLYFRHTLAILEFQFVLGFESTEKDALLECWIENTTEDGIHTIGTLIAGVGSSDLRRGAETDEEKKHREKNHFVWSTYQTMYEGVKIYDWGVAKKEDLDGDGDLDFPVGSGIEFWNGYMVDGKPTVQHAVAYSDLKEAGTDVSKVFSGNGGHLLVIPQEYDGASTLNFLLRSTQDESTAVNIPAYTGTNADGEQYDEANPDHAKRDFDHYCAGYIYKYTITVTRARMYIDVHVEPWNELHSSAEIIF